MASPRTCLDEICSSKTNLVFSVDRPFETDNMHQIQMHVSTGGMASGWAGGVASG